MSGYERKPKLLRDTHFYRERPREKERILSAGILPDILIAANGEKVWDGVTARQKDGRVTYLTDDGTAALLILARRGHFGNLSDVILDFSRHSAIRALIDRGFDRDPRIREWTPANDPKTKNISG